mmetsp:Transcript_24595/g.38186  ORF Transcript_24595/g.38186 Transcript_24595/m.38186 type:complete len:109 (-) Transcript_24595:46-372(-)
MTGSLTQSYFLLDCNLNKVGRRIYFGLDDDMPPPINEGEFLEKLVETEKMLDAKSKQTKSALGSPRSKLSSFSKFTTGKKSNKSNRSNKDGPVKISSARSQGMGSSRS